MFEDESFTFAARLKTGAVFGQDRHTLRWAHGYGNDNPELEFVGTLLGINEIRLAAPGFGHFAKSGEPRSYGNGALHTSNLNSLILAAHDRERIVAEQRRRKQMEVDAASAQLSKLQAEMNAIK